MTAKTPQKRTEVLIGGGIGALVVASANWFSDPSVKQAVLYAAPFISTAVGAAIAWFKSFGLNELQIKHYEWKLRRLRKHYAEIQANPHHSEADKLATQKTVNDLDLLIFSMKNKDIPVIENKKRR